MKLKPTFSDKHLRTFWLCLLLISSWLLWSGIFKPLLLGLGAFSCFLTLFIVQRMDILDNSPLSVRFNGRFVLYWLWLAKEISKSSLQVARVVLDPRLPISPRIFEIEAKSLDIVDQALLGNSITLTPGTLAMDLHEGIIKVHSLTQESADELMSGEMTRRVLALREAS